jgi:hypothetical protein
LNLVAIAWERVCTEEAATRAGAARQSEEFKPPLTSIKAASTSMLSDSTLLSPQSRELATIID